MGTQTPDLTQTFCIYCQEEMGTPEKLREHLREEHLGSTAQRKLAP